MGFLDKAKEKATHLAGQAKDKIEDVKDKRKSDDLLDDLGRIVYRQRTERGEPGDEAEIVRLVGELRTLEADGIEVVAAASAAVEGQQSSSSSSSPPPPPAYGSSFPQADQGGSDTG